MATWEDGVPEVVAPAITVNTTTGYSTLTWEAPRARTRVIPFGTWSANGALNFDSVRVNDNETVAAAFNWPSIAGTAEVILDLGAGLEQYYRGVRLCFDTTSVAVAPYTISYSADATTWFAVTPTSTVSTTSGVYAKRVPQWATPASALPRYWKIARTSGVLASVITEVWFFAFEVADAEVDEVRLYNADAVCAFVPGGAITEPLNISPFVSFVDGTWENDGTRTTSYDLTLKVFDGEDESAGVTFAAESIVGGDYPVRLWATVDIETQASFAPAVGTNNDIELLLDARKVRLTDPGGNFTITGVETGYAPAQWTGGDEVTLFHEETRTGTFNHDSGLSFAGNRIKTYSGANVTMNGPFEVHLRYVNTTAPYWRFEWGRDSTGFK